jgi:hypothetical protein
VTTLVGKVDPDNVPSARVMQKSGAKSGERLKGGWKRKGEDGQEEERDFVCWILERPGMEEESHGGEREKGLDTTSNQILQHVFNYYPRFQVEEIVWCQIY